MCLPIYNVRYLSVLGLCHMGDLRKYSGSFSGLEGLKHRTITHQALLEKEGGEYIIVQGSFMEGY